MIRTARVSSPRIHSEPVRFAVTCYAGLRATNSRVSNRFFRTRKSRSCGSCVARQRVEAREVREDRARCENIALDARGCADATDDVIDLEAAVVEQLAHSPFGRHEVVGVVDVPEEPALLEVVRHDDEENAAGPEHA